MRQIPPDRGCPGLLPIEGGRTPSPPKARTMLTTRLIPILYLMNGLIVRSEGFRTHQNIGNVLDEARRYVSWDIDELVYIDITREGAHDARRDDHRTPSFDSAATILSAISDFCFYPLTFGGQLRTLEDVEAVRRGGAEKFITNTQAATLVPAISRAYGCQAAVASIDYRNLDGVPIVHTHNGTKNTGVSVGSWVTECERLGAGEILLNSIDRDGKGRGFDIPTIRIAAANTRLPVVACGGAGDDWDFVECAKETGASGIAAGNFFHFTEHSYPRVKALMRKEGINVRPPAEDEVL